MNQERKSAFEAELSNHSTAASKFVGMNFSFGNITCVIREVQAYSREHQLKGVYKPLTQPNRPDIQAPVKCMDVYCPRLMQAILLLIVTREGGLTGSCVLIRSIELDGEVIKGPGKCSKALGITEPRVWGRLELLNTDTVQLVLNQD